MIINSSSELQKQIMKHMKTAIIKMENEVHEVIDKFLHQYYSEYNPSVYERTSQLLHSLVKSEVISNGMGYECHVYFDLEKIDYSYKYINGKRYKNDTSKIGGTEGIVKLAMESNTHGGFVADKNTAIWNESMAELNNDKIAILKQCLLDSGIPIE